MRSLFISLILFTFTLVGSFWSLHHMTNELTTICTTLDQIGQAITAQSWSEAQALFADMETTWENSQAFWHVVLDQKEISDIQANIMRVGAYIKAEDFAQGLAETTALNSQYNHIMAMEKVNLANIF